MEDSVEYLDNYFIIYFSLNIQTKFASRKNLTTLKSNSLSLIRYRWWKDERFAFTNRSYTSKDVAVIRPTISTITPSHYLSKKLYWTLRRCFNQKGCSNTFGALDNIQAITMSKHLSSTIINI